MLWTIVEDELLTPVLPYDCNPDAEWDEGMLVYLTEEAAAAAANHQMELYDINCHPRQLTPGFIDALRRVSRKQRDRVKRDLVGFIHMARGG